MSKPGFGKRIRERKQEEERKIKEAKREQRRQAKKENKDDPGYNPYPMVEREMPPLD